MPTFISDTFTAANGTLLTAHTPNVGGAWTGSSGVTIQSNQIVTNNFTSTTVLYNATTAPATDFDVSMDIVFSGATAGQSAYGVAGRGDISTGNYYAAICDAGYSGGGTQLRLSSFASGTETILGTVPFTYTQGQTHSLKLSMQDSTISLLFDNTSQISVTDTTYGGGGNAGIYTADVASQCLHGDNFLAAGPAAPTFGYVQSAADTEGSLGTTAIVTLGTGGTGTPVTLHNLLVADVFWASNTATCSLADTQNNLWVPVGSPVLGTGNLTGASYQQFYALNAKVGNTTVTATTTSAVDFFGLAVTEASIVGGPAVFDKNAYGHITSGIGATFNSSQITTTANGDYVHASAITDNAVSGTNVPFTTRESVNWGNNVVADEPQITAGNVLCTFNGVSATEALSGIIAFKPAGTTTSTGNFFHLIR